MRATAILFAPELCIKNGVMDVDFYINGLGAEELRRFSNEDGSIHVSELAIGGALFHLHQENISKGELSPLDCKGVTATIGLFVDDVDSIIDKALAAGATLVSSAQDYDYGYRQGIIRDPNGHRWMIQKKI